jgi:hypothetical protein
LLLVRELLSQDCPSVFIYFGTRHNIDTVALKCKIEATDTGKE